MWMLIGAIAGATVSYAMADRPPLILSATYAALGGVLVTATRRFTAF